jgi:hypothetical protein
MFRDSKTLLHTSYFDTRILSGAASGTLSFSFTIRSLSDRKTSSSICECKSGRCRFGLSAGRYEVLFLQYETYVLR